MTPQDLAPLIDAFQTLVVPVLGYILKLLWDIREHLARLNGRVYSLEKWTEAHERRDEKRVDELRQEIRDCPGRSGAWNSHHG